MRIFDFHLHPGYDFHNNDTDMHRFVRILKQSGVCGCAGSYINMDMNRKPAEEFVWRIPELNEKAWEFQRAYPDYFVPGIHIHPDFLEMSCLEMEKHKARGGVLLGELVNYMMGYRYNHPGLRELLHYAKELGMVVSMHPSNNMEDNLVFAEWAQGMDVVIAHLGMHEGILHEDMIALMQKNPHIYVDLAAYGGAQPGKLRDAVNRVGSERILYGTDHPGVNDETQQKRYIDYVLSEGLKPENMENIFYNNAARLLKFRTA